MAENKQFISYGGMHIVRIIMCSPKNTESMQWQSFEPEDFAKMNFGDFGFFYAMSTTGSFYFATASKGHASLIYRRLRQLDFDPTVPGSRYEFDIKGWYNIPAPIPEKSDDDDDEEDKKAKKSPASSSKEYNAFMMMNVKIELSEEEMAQGTTEIKKLCSAIGREVSALYNCDGKRGFVVVPKEHGKDMLQTLKDKSFSPARTTKMKEFENGLIMAVGAAPPEMRNREIHPMYL